MEDYRVINELVKRESSFIDELMFEVEKVIVGQKEMIKRVLVGLLTGGHVLLEGVPGLAKTLTVKTICEAIQAKFQRIQFTPDLLPADIIGTVIYNQQTGSFTSKKGPIFANLILADEINRAPAKVQSALLEAMQERQVTIGDTTYPLEEPFLVLATQNPIEQEGTYPLPEAQIDRFLLKVKVDYPKKEEELKIMDRMATEREIKINPVIKPQKILEARKTVEQIHVAEELKQYILDIVFATRYPEEYGLSNIKHYIEYGASPRASIGLLRASRAMAFLEHRGYVIPDDIKTIGMDILRHRIILSYEAEAEELTTEDIIKIIFESIKVP